MIHFHPRLIASQQQLILYKADSVTDATAISEATIDVISYSRNSSRILHASNDLVKERTKGTQIQPNLVEQDQRQTGDDEEKALLFMPSHTSGVHPHLLHS